MIFHKHTAQLSIRVDYPQQVHCYSSTSRVLFKIPASFFSIPQFFFSFDMFSYFSLIFFFLLFPCFKLMIFVYGTCRDLMVFCRRRAHHHTPSRVPFPYIHFIEKELQWNLFLYLRPPLLCFSCSWVLWGFFFQEMSLSKAFSKRCCWCWLLSLSIYPWSLRV